MVTVTRLAAILILPVFAAQISLAASYDIQAPTKKILVSVQDAHVIVNGSAQKTRITLNDSAETSYAVMHDGETVTIKLKEGLQSSSDSKKKLIEIQAPAQVLEVHAFEGEITLSKWNDEALLHLQKGRTFVSDVKGDVKVHNITGDIVIDGCTGKLEVDSFKANATIKNHNGDLRLENFMADAVVDNLKGVVNVSQGQGSFKITKSSGAFQFDQAKGILNVVQFAGRVEGTTQDGPVNINMTSETEVSVRSQSGKVTVHSPSVGGVFLNLATQEGDIYAPTYLKVNREGSQKSLRARMKGESQKGTVFVRSQEGGIFIR